jgi:uncharacterized protein (DUF2235 family)
MLTTDFSVPPSRGRNLVLCCDGTSNQFGRKNTNVVRLLPCLRRNPAEQMIYYDPGVGTLPEPNRFSRLAKWWSKTTGLAFGTGPTTDVLEGHAYQMQQFAPNDQVFIFGSSRGAYTARASLRGPRVLLGTRQSLHGNIFAGKEYKITAKMSAYCKLLTCLGPNK